MNEVLRNVIQILVDNQEFFEFFITTTVILHYDTKVFYATVERNALKNKEINVLPAPLLVKKDRKTNIERFDKKYRKDIEEF